jgi:hypothetical protein
MEQIMYDELYGDPTQRMLLEMAANAYKRRFKGCKEFAPAQLGYECGGDDIYDEGEDGELLVVGQTPVKYEGLGRMKGNTIELTSNGITVATYKVRLEAVRGSIKGRKKQEVTA